ncbi:YebY family protein [Klebsiella quasipneumoniae subsp. quasipneumoniae]
MSLAPFIERAQKLC